MEERLAALERDMESLLDWQRQVDTLLRIVVGAAEPIIDEDGGTPRATAPGPPE